MKKEFLTIFSISWYLRQILLFKWDGKSNKLVVIYERSLNSQFTWLNHQIFILSDLYFGRFKQGRKQNTKINVKWKYYITFRQWKLQCDPKKYINHKTITPWHITYKEKYINFMFHRIFIEVKSTCFMWFHLHFWRIVY